MATDKRFEFPITLYGVLEEYNQVLTKGRCRIFYKGGNRNRTYITDEFAEQLVSTLPYTPIKGIFDSTADDYTDHGRQRYDGRVYGIVPENPNFQWEFHEDNDGVVREYACVDILLFTSIYQEARKIVGQAQSMELYAPSIKGDWKYINGKKYFVFSEGCFLGLQVLGKDVEPCFEGASFYTENGFIERLENIMDKLEKYDLDIVNNEGGKKMAVIDFKLSDNQKYNMLFSLLNPNFNEEGEWVMDYMLNEVYDAYALAYNLHENGYERVFYTKDDSTDSVEITGKEAAFIVDVNENEKKALEALHELDGVNFETINEQYSELQTNNQTLQTKVDEYEQTINSLNEEKEQLEVTLNTTKENYESSQTTIEELNSEIDTLKQFKLDIETNEKTNIIDKYADKLEESFLNDLRENIADYTATELEKELAFALVNATPALFTNDNSNFVPKDNNEETGIDRILSKYKK